MLQFKKRNHLLTLKLFKICTLLKISDEPKRQAQTACYYTTIIDNRKQGKTKPTMGQNKGKTTE